MWKVISYIIAYLLIGIVVTYMFFANKSVPMGAAVIVYAGPLIWPVFIVVSIGQAIGNVVGNIDMQHHYAQQYEQNIKECPDGYHTVCLFVYGNTSEISFNDAYDTYLNLTKNSEQQDNNKKLQEIAKILLSKANQDYVQQAQTALTNATTNGRYIITDAISRKVINDISFNRISYDAIILLVDQYDQLADSNIYAPFALASLYYTAADYSNDSITKIKYRRKASDLYYELAVKTEDRYLMLEAMHGFFANSNPYECIKLLTTLNSMNKTFKTTKAEYSGDEPLLRVRQLNNETYCTTSITSSYLDLISDKESQFAIMTLLLPIAFTGNCGSIAMEYRDAVYHQYLNDGDTKWFNVVNELLAKYPEYDNYTSYFLCEQAYLQKDLIQAEKYFYQYLATMGEQYTYAEITLNNDVLRYAYITDSWSEHLGYTYNFRTFAESCVNNYISRKQNNI